jgi:hypothetical protein
MGQLSPEKKLSCVHLFLLLSIRRRGPVKTTFGAAGGFLLGIERVTDSGGGEMQYRRPKSVSSPQELEVRTAGGRANF